MSPSLSFVLGVLVGWLLQLLLEVLFFRRKTLEWQRQAAQAVKDRTASENELARVRRELAATTTDLAATRTDLMAARAVQVLAPPVEVRTIPAPASQLPVVEPPLVETLPVETPTVATPALDTLPVVTAAVELLLPLAETRTIKAAVVELPVVEPPLAETLPIVDASVELPVVGPPWVETSPVEAPSVELPVIEARSVPAAAEALPIVQEVQAVEIPAAAVPAIEAPVVEMLAADLTVEEPILREDRSAELPVIESPAAEVPALETLSIEAPSFRLSAPAAVVAIAPVAETLATALVTTGTEGVSHSPVWPGVGEALLAEPEPPEAHPAALELDPGPAEVPVTPFETASMRAVELPDGAPPDLPPGALLSGPFDVQVADGAGWIGDVEIIPGIDMGPVAAPDSTTPVPDAPADVDMGTAVAPAAAELPTRALALDSASGPPGSDGATIVPEAPNTCSCPQHLSDIAGIGTVYEQKLHAAGIGTFYDLVCVDDADLRRILGERAFQRIDLAAVKAAATRLARDTGAWGHSWDGSLPDGFEALTGIGPIYEGRLYSAGICSYRALAAVTPEQLAQICPPGVGKKPDYAAWIAQAEARAGIADDLGEVRHVG